MNDKYRDTLNNISKNILSLESDLNLTTLKEDTVGNFNIYTNNYLYMAIDRLSIDYTGTVKYLGKNNFSYFVRKMLLDTGITSPNFTDFSKNFSSYLETQKDIHEDEILMAISRVDKLWAFEETGFTITFKGILLFWKELLDGVKTENKIDLSKNEKIEVVSINGENFLKVVQTSDDIVKY